MSDISRNYIDLMYLTNPSNISKMRKMKEEKNINKEELKKYNKDIIKITERLIDGEKISSEIDALFNKYFIKIREHIKFTKKKNVVQSQYHLMKEKEKKEYIKMDLSNLDITIMKKPEPKIKNIGDFVKKKKKERKGKKVVMPKKIIFE
jgi:phosphoribosyl-dephospho-CoA transferase